MKTLILSSFIVAALTPVRASAQNVVEVANNRLRLADVVPNAPADIADIDLGGAPEPGERRVLSQATIRAQLARQGVDARKLAIPRAVIITRKAQMLSSADIEALAEREIIAILPQGLTVSRVKAPRGISMPSGEVLVRITAAPQLRAGVQSLMLDLRVGDSAGRKVAVTVECSGETRATTAVRRGDRVLIVAVRNGLTLQLYGLAQNDGRVGDSVSVMPSDGNKMLRARVRDAATVDVTL